MTVPGEYGSSDMGYLAHLVAMGKSRASGSVGLELRRAFQPVREQPLRQRQRAQRRKYLPKLCSGEWKGALAMSEPGAGSDVVGSMSCRAKLRDGAWVANGNKMWITNGPEADVLVVYMQHRGQDAGSKCMTAFIVEGHEGLFHRAEAGQVRHARQQHLRAGVRGLRNPGRERAGRGPQRREGADVGLNTERLVLTGGPLA